jgi:TfoX/Sxy family transcriptional regulator of competence genes
MDLSERGENIMSSSKEYLSYILEQLSLLENISYRTMMGEYILYYCGKVIGGIYDNRFLVKPVKTAKMLMPDAVMELPYDGAKGMLLVTNVEDREFLKKNDGCHI